MTDQQQRNGFDHGGADRRQQARRHSDSGHTMRELDTALKVCPMPLLLVDPTGRILMANAPLEALFDYAPGTLSGAPAREV